MICKKILPCLLFLFIAFSRAAAQQYDKCGTMILLENKISKNPSLQLILAQKENQLQENIQENAFNRSITRIGVVTIPVVFHIVMTNPNVVTNAQIMAQLDTLNKDYSGENGDSVKIPAAFKSLFGKSGIRFCLAQRTPADDVTTGIVRYQTNTTAFSVNNDNIKHASTGGATAWNTSKYLNIWIGNLSNNILGYSSLPDDGVPDEQGVVIHYSSLPGGSTTNYNKGKTLTHEIGHYFFLYHIWGDDDGACTGSDEVDDTPNQANSTSGCPGGVVTDNCNKTSAGVMYQNYMDYSNDDCLVMFTAQQVTRMETALTTYRSTLLTSNGCISPILFTRNVQLKNINSPAQRLCSGSFTPAVTIKNLGLETINALQVSVQVDQGPITSLPWTGSLTALSTTSITLNPVTTNTGYHILHIYTSNPNGNVDEDHSNDTLHFPFIYYLPITPPVAESFEGSIFPPTAWDIVNPDSSYSWEKITGIAKTGNASVVIRNFNYQKTGQHDDLRLPETAMPTADSAFFTFELAASPASSTITATSDTLEVLLSTDCGNTYTNLYRKWGSALVTSASTTFRTFLPTATEWRKDSINLTPYMALGKFMIAFRNISGNQNNIYLDDINLYTKTVNPNLKAKGFLVSPNPTTGKIAIQFYPQPEDLKAIIIYSATGQKIIEQKISSASNYYSFDLSGQAPGIFIVRAIFTDRTITQKLLKVR